MFAIRTTVYTTIQYTPVQLDFGRDLVTNERHHVDWEAIKKRKQDLINKGNEKL